MREIPTEEVLHAILEEERKISMRAGKIGFALTILSSIVRALTPFLHLPPSLSQAFDKISEALLVSGGAASLYGLVRSKEKEKIAYFVELPQGQRVCPPEKKKEPQGREPGEEDPQPPFYLQPLPDLGPENPLEPPSFWRTGKDKDLKVTSPLFPLRGRPGHSAYDCNAHGIHPGPFPSPFAPSPF